MTTDIKAAVLRNELAIIIGCLDGRSAHEKAESVIAWMDKYDQRASIQPVAAQGPTLQAHVMPPFAAPAGQHDAGASVLTPERIVELFRQNVGNAWNNETFNCVGFARAIEAEFASRFRAQGGNTSPESNPAAPAQPAPDPDELQFNAQRLRNVAKLVGLESAVPKDDATLDGARGAVLGMIAAKLRERNSAAPAQAATDEVREDWASRPTEPGLHWYAESAQFPPSQVELEAAPDGVLYSVENNAQLGMGFKGKRLNNIANAKGLWLKISIPPYPTSAPNQVGAFSCARVKPGSFSSACHEFCGDNETCFDSLRTTSTDSQKGGAA